MRDDLEWDSYWGSVDISVIDVCERELGYEFPKSYKNIVSSYNGAYVIGKDAYRFYSNLTSRDEIYSLGLLHAFGESDSIAETMAWSLAHKPFGFPPEFVSFARDGGGNLLCFDYGNDSHAEPKVVLWHANGQPGSGKEMSKISSSFDNFLDMLFEE